MIPHLNAFIRNIFRKKLMDQDLNEEIHSFLDLVASERVRGGMSPDDALREARRVMGGVELVKENVRDIRVGSALVTVMQDLRYGFRSLRQSAALSITCIVVLMLGISANATIFSAVKAILFDPLPYRDPSRLVALYEAGVVKGDVHDEPAPANFYDWQKQSSSFEEIAAYGGTDGNLSGGVERLPEHVNGVFCSWNLFRTLGAAATIGRVFTASDDLPKAARTIILSSSLWRHRFGSDVRAVGQTLRLDAQLYTIVGIMPREFEFPASTTQFWVPMQLALPQSELETRTDHRLAIVARLKPGVSIQQSTAELTGIQARIARTFSGQTGSSVEVYTLESQLLDRKVRTSLYVLWAAVGCVFLIACVNVANLLLTHGTARQKEIAVRIALGASKARIIQLFLLESLLLSLCGAVAGVALAEWLTRLVARLSASLPRAAGIHLDWATVLFAAGLALAAGVLAGALPAAAAPGLDISRTMHETSRTTIGSIRMTWYRSWLVAGEIALSFVLLIAAGLLLKSLLSLQSVNLGFDSNNLLTMRVTLPVEQYPTEAKSALFFEQLLTRVRTISGVQAAGLISWLPVAGQYMNTNMAIAGRPLPPRDEANIVIPRTADPGYFHAMGIPLERGRVFEPQERLEQADKAVVSSSLVRKYFPNEDPIGKYVFFWNKRRQIIGVVGDVRKNLDQLPEPTIYVPISGGELNFAALVVRAQGDPLRLAIPIEREIAHLDPSLAVSDVLTTDQLISKRTANQHFTLLLLMSFAGVAVLLATVGLYSVISYSTAQRTSEFGVRMALGAQREDLIRSVLRQGMKPTLIGMAAGLLMALGSVRLLQAMLFQVSPVDGAVFACVGCGMLVISVAASLIPALRSTRINTAQVLRAE